MESIIRNTNFVHDDETISESFDDDLRIWINDNEDTCTSDQVFQALDAVGDKLLGQSCPCFGTKGWEQAKETYNRLTSLADRLEGDSRMNKTDLQEHCLQQSMKFHRHGPATIHGEIIKTYFRGGRVSMSKYTKTLQGEKIMEYITAVCTPIAKREDSDLAKFYVLARREIDFVLDKDFNKPELQKKEYMNKMMDFAVHLFLDYFRVPEAGFENIPRAARGICDYYKELWEATPDLPQLKSYLQQIVKRVRDPGFPQSKDVPGAITDLIYRIRYKASGPEYPEKLGCEIIELLGLISRSKIENEKSLFDFFTSVLYFFRDQDKDYVKNKPIIFTTLAPPFKKLLAEIDMKFLINTYYVRELITVLDKAFAKNKKLVAEWLGLSVALLRRPCSDTLMRCRHLISQTGVYKWKDHKEIADQMFEAFSAVQVPKEDGNLKDFFDQLEGCFAYFLEGLKTSRLIKNYGKGLMFLSINFLELKEPAVFSTAEKVAEHIEISVKENKDSVMEVMNRLSLLLKDDDLPWHTKWNLQRAVEDLLGSVLDPVEDGRIFTNDEMRIFITMIVICLNKDGLNPEDNRPSSHFRIAEKIMSKVIPWLGTTKRLGMAVKVIPLLIKFFDEDDENLNRSCSRFLSDFANHEAGTVVPFFEKLLKIYIDKEDIHILKPINQIYPANPKPLKEYFQPLMAQFLERVERDVTYGLGELFSTASRKQPELFTGKNVKGLLERAKNDSGNATYLIQILQELCRRKPEMMVKYLDQLMMQNAWNPTLLNSVHDMVCCLALDQRNVADKVLDFLLKNAGSCQEESNVITALNSVRQVGYKYPIIIKPKRHQIEHLKLADPSTEGLRKSIIDMIDGKTPNDVKRELEEKQQELTELVNKVEEVEIAVVAMMEEFDSQGEQLKSMKTGMADQEKRLDQVEETVDETIVKVEEIDSKTLSHAPYWSRDISKLLNPQTEHDWRLLSSRLGYSNDDIRGWAQQADPCMAMLNEWYATRKTSEATLSILTHLQEMDRMDAAIIVENAMKNAEAVVEDEEFEYASPPPIFISYQWGHQEEVKLLKKHLEMAGYECWMDIGQMGGGDKLFEKIDNGIRAAKVVISCITNKYTKSPNCNREVNLSLGLHKPIIPLLLEQCPWPPPGSMGPIFSESLFIRFFQRKGEETTDQRYWPEPKFLELLMQLNMNGLPPDEGKIEPVYKQWWMPIEEEIKIDKNKTRNGAQASQAVKTDSDNAEKESPEVFISYQWGKQKNIIKLYERLTSMGFSCWLDIKQMGGGDSLYDKIDRGIRGSKMVLSCVTQKYALSANCRREVSLADALKKPLLPLLLEKMTWPPAGPMSMVMTQLLYIGFTEEEQQISWQGPQFDELLSKLYEHMPEYAPQKINKGDTNGPKADEEKEDEKKKKEPPAAASKAASAESEKLTSQNTNQTEKTESEAGPGNEISQEKFQTPNTAKPKAGVKPIPAGPGPSTASPAHPTLPDKEKKSKTCSII